mgnify:FL=1|jgi:UDP-galactopyranose mutase|tara:strand:- start:1253 stop:2347 length:1095 start_codon:yes stop_codon:yes gene_type:complete
MAKEYDFLIVGSGWYGSVCARELTDMGYRCLVIDKRDHIGGNCFTEKVEGINVHKYGPHIFHTSNKVVWEYVNKFAEFNNYRHHVVANYKGELYSLPFNMWTFNKLWGVITPEEARAKIESQTFLGDPTNLEEQAISLVGTEIYQKLIKGYTEKQWLKSAKDLPAFIIKRLPVRFVYDNNYFFDTFQGIPKNGYTQVFEKLLEGIDVKLNLDYFIDKDTLDSLSQNIIYTGPIDKYYDYKFGDLQYRPLKFKTKILDKENFQGHSVVNYTSSDIPYTRIIEHKHFNNDVSDKTVVTREYPIEYSKDEEPYYPLNDKPNQKKYQKYFKLSQKENNIFFGGRLAEYKYYDQHQVIESALGFVNQFK